MLDIFDVRTGGQGARHIGNATLNRVYKETIYAIADESAGKKLITGLNDNTIIFNLAYYQQLFGNPKIICIFRHPVDVALSIWHHNHRLAEAEPENAESHLSLFKSVDGNLESFVRAYCAKHNASINSLYPQLQHKNICVILYEQLVNNKAELIIKLLTFLQAEFNTDIIDMLIENSSKAKMAADSSAPEFFEREKITDTKNVITAELRHEMDQLYKTTSNKLRSLEVT